MKRERSPLEFREYRDILEYYRSDLGEIALGDGTTGWVRRGAPGWPWRENDGGRGRFAGYRDRGERGRRSGQRWIRQPPAARPYSRESRERVQEGRAQGRSRRRRVFCITGSGPGL